MTSQFYFNNDIEISKQVKTSHPWSFSNNGTESRYHKSLAILHGGRKNWESKETQVFGLLDKTMVLETPSFKLIVKKHTDKDFARHQAVLPLKSNCDLIILPTEAGIDTYVYWDNISYKLYVSEEMP